mmetsp:Transcript_72776/g.116087  ORF Transcript_72776/g.116087 Transcript_72776/m.116087 type:complete len:137 (+) Transcript_72776:117-527(+)
MSMKALFIANGAFEALAAFFVCSKPSTFTEGNKLTRYGQMYSRRFGYLLGSFAISSIIIAQQPDSPIKHVYALSWSMFHFATFIDRLLFPQRRRKIIGVIIHAAFSLAFLYYVYQSGFQQSTMIPHMIWRTQGATK